MELEQLVKQNRSIRRFVQDHAVAHGVLREVVGLARLSPSARNQQPLKYLLSSSAERNARIFSHLAWASDLPHWRGPAEGERPAAYILILGDRNVTTDFGCDHGIAAQTIKLALTERGLGSCIIGSIQRQALAAELGLAPQLEILLAIAIGKAAEQVQLETVGEDGETRYWRDGQDVHHVPKRSLDEVIVEPG